jgi:hypothetical protein
MTRGGATVSGKRWGVGVVAAGRLIPVRVGDIEIEVETVPVAGTEATFGRAEKAAGSALEAFGRAQDAIIEVARSTAQMIEKAGASARPDRVDVEFGLKFSASGTVIMAGVAGEASLKVTLGYDVTARPVGVPAEVVTAPASQGLPSELSAGAS